MGSEAGDGGGWHRSGASLCRRLQNSLSREHLEFESDTLIDGWENLSINMRFIRQRLLLDSTWKVILSLRFVLVGGVLVDLAG